MRAFTPPWCAPSHAVTTSSTHAMTRCRTKMLDAIGGAATIVMSTSAVVRSETGTSTTSVLGSALSASSTTAAEKIEHAETTLPSALSSSR